MALATSCRSRKPGSASGGPAGSVAAPVSTCVPLAPGKELVLGSRTERPRAAAREPQAEGEDAEDEVAIDLPFSVELGQARSGERAFAVPAIENRKGANFAVLAVLDAEADGHVLDLGRVFGDVEPPVVAAFGERFLLAVPDGDVAGLRLRLMLLDAPYATGDLRRGPELRGVRRDDPGYSLAVSEGSGLLAFNTLDKEQGRIAIARIDPLVPARRGSLEVLPGARDVSGPRLVPRPSGFYLAYLARPSSLPGGTATERGPAASLAPVPTAPPSPEGDPSESGEAEPIALEIAPLDRDGALVGRTLRVSPEGAKVLAFDVAALPEGGALLTYRDARGQDGVQAIVVRPDGTFERRRWEVGESSGVPSLLMDPKSGASARRGFVALADEGDTKLALIGADPLALGAFTRDPGLAQREPLAVRGDRFLSGTLHGTERHLAVVDCSRAKGLR